MTCHKTSLRSPYIEPEYMCRKYLPMNGNKNADASDIRPVLQYLFVQWMIWYIFIYVEDVMFHQALGNRTFIIVQALHDKSFVLIQNGP